MSQDSASSTVMRLFELYRKVPSHRGAPKSTQSLYQDLLGEGYDVSKRTVERDLRKLEAITEVFAVVTEEGNLWKNSNKNLDVVPVMQPAEALLLIIATEQLAHSLPPEILSLLKIRVEKAKQTLDKRNKLHHWRNKLDIIGGQIPHDHDEYDEELRKAIYDAVLSEQQLKLSYRKVDANIPADYELNPLGIVVREHSQYLVATKVSSPEFPQLFSLRRIYKAECLFKPARRPREFSVADYVDSNPTGWRLEAEPYQISLKVRWYAVDWLTHNRLHPSQVLSRIDDEWYRIQFNSHITYDLVGWIMRFTTDVVVESPKPLADFVRTRLKETSAYYE
ncbi:helix-turn-helix transcriptional regulator [Vibrio breoganii]